MSQAPDPQDKKAEEDLRTHLDAIDQVIASLWSDFTITDELSVDDKQEMLASAYFCPLQVASEIEAVIPTLPVTGYHDEFCAEWQPTAIAPDGNLRMELALFDARLEDFASNLFEQLSELDLIAPKASSLLHLNDDKFVRLIEIIASGSIEASNHGSPYRFRLLPDLKALNQPERPEIEIEAFSSDQVRLIQEIERKTDQYGVERIDLKTSYGFTWRSLVETLNRWEYQDKLTTDHIQKKLCRGNTIERLIRTGLAGFIAAQSYHPKEFLDDVFAPDKFHTTNRKVMFHNDSVHLEVRINLPDPDIPGEVLSPYRVGYCITLKDFGKLNITQSFMARE